MAASTAGASGAAVASPTSGSAPSAVRRLTSSSSQGGAGVERLQYAFLVYLRADVQLAHGEAFVVDRGVRG